VPEIKHGVPTKYNWVVLCPQNFKMGKYVDIGAFTLIAAHHGVDIGDNCQIGSHCSIYSMNTIDDQMGTVIIEKNACVGAGSVVLPDVIVGDGAKVGALSLVKSGTRIPPGEVWVGVPAKQIK